MYVQHFGTFGDGQFSCVKVLILRNSMYICNSQNAVRRLKPSVFVVPSLFYAKLVCTGILHFKFCYSVFWLNPARGFLQSLCASVYLCPCVCLLTT